MGPAAFDSAGAHRGGQFFSVTVGPRVPGQPSRGAAHVLLDAVTAYGPRASTQASTAAANLALERLNALDAVTASLDDNGDGQLNIDGLANAALYVIYLLAAQLAHATNVDTDTVVAEVREIVDDGL